MKLDMDRTSVQQSRSPLLHGRTASRQIDETHKRLRPSGSATRLPPCKRDTKCGASIILDRLPLSSYDFPELPSGAVEPTTLESAVKEAVKHIGQAPFLQLQQGQLSSRHDASDSLLEDPQVWDDIAGQLAQREAEIVLLVHRLDKLEPERVGRKVPGSFDVMTGITSASQQGGLESIAELLRTETAKADFSGKVGDCCDEEMVSQVVPFTRANRSSGQHHRHATLDRSQQWQQEKANYWGVVLQSRSNEQESGCYILKTVHSGVGDCTCVHWTLTRLRHGYSFLDQINSAWLL